MIKKRPFKTKMKITPNHFKTGGVNRPHPTISHGMNNQASNMGPKPTACSGEMVGQDTPNLTP